MAAVDESDEALAAVMQFNYSKPNVYSGKFFLVDEAHNLLRPCAPAVKHLKGLLVRAADLTIAAFTATPIVQRASDLQELAQLVGANAMPAVSTLAQHLDHYPRVAPLGCLDGSVLIDAPESIVTCTPLRGRLQDRYVHAHIARWPPWEIAEALYVAVLAAAPCLRRTVLGGPRDLLPEVGLGCGVCGIYARKECGDCRAMCTPPCACSLAAEGRCRCVRGGDFETVSTLQ